MATPIFSLLPLAFLLLLLSATAATRPCKTIFFFSATTTTTTTLYPLNPRDFPNPNPNPNPNPLIHGQSPRRLTLIFTTITRFQIRRPSLDFVAVRPSIGDPRSSSPPSDLPLRFYSAVSSSIGDRSRGAVTVAAALAALLLGVGCGALTAFALYFVYVVFTCRRRRVDFDGADSSSDDDDDDDVTVAKRFSYVPIPELADDDVKKPAKEVV